MFAKLLKHEWKATSKLLGILSLCALSIGVLGGLAIRVIIAATEKVTTDGTAALVISGSVFLIMGLFLALVLYAAGTEIYLLIRFYKTRFTDEGYLTFTLPVSNRSIFLSSYVDMLFWMLISIVTVFAAILIGAVIACAGNLDLQTIQTEMEYMGYVYAEAGFDGYFLVQTIGVVISALSSIMIMMGCITVGAVIARKHKILAAIGIYYGQSVVMGMIASVIQVASAFTMIDTNATGTQFALMMGLTYVIQAAWGVGAYFLSMHLINKKLNLP